MTTVQKKPNGIIIVAGLFVAAIGIAAAVFLSNATEGNAATCSANPEHALAIENVAQGELAALLGTGKGRSYNDMRFLDETGEEISLEKFAGKKLLINFWATWCIPCREEMPYLDDIAAKYAGEDFDVVAISLDLGSDGPNVAKLFLEEIGTEHLALYADPSYKVFEKLRNEAISIGLPATVLVDGSGCELAVLQGPAHWNTPDGYAVIEKLLSL